MPEFLWYRLLAPYVKQCAGATAGAECMSALNNLLFGPSSLIKPEDFELILQTWPASVSTRNLHHWASMFRTAELDFRWVKLNPHHHHVTHQTIASTPSMLNPV